MSMIDKTKFAAKFAARYLTPWPSISRAGSSVAGSVSRTVSLVKATREQMRAARERDIEEARIEAEVMRQHKGETPAQLYEANVLNRGWDLDEQARQQLRRRWAKRSFLFVLAVVMAAQVWAAVSGSLLWLVCMSVVLVLSLITLPLAAAHSAHIEWQIERREIFPFRTFMGQRDFFKRLVF